MYYRLPNKEILRGFQMNNINFIQNAIMQLEGGAFQKLFDAYLYKKYKFNNIQTLGVQTGTNKTTKGTPDAYVLTDDKKYMQEKEAICLSDNDSFNECWIDCYGCFPDNYLE